MTEEEYEQKAKEQCRLLLRSDKAYDGLADYDFWMDGYKQCLKDYGIISYTSVKKLEKENEELKATISTM